MSLTWADIGNYLLFLNACALGIWAALLERRRRAASAYFNRARSDLDRLEAAYQMGWENLWDWYDSSKATPDRLRTAIDLCERLNMQHSRDLDEWHAKYGQPFGAKPAKE